MDFVRSYFLQNPYFKIIADYFIFRVCIVLDSIYIFHIKIFVLFYSNSSSFFEIEKYWKKEKQSFYLCNNDNNSSTKTYKNREVL